MPRWRESEAFTPLKRDVLTYAEAMTDTPATVDDALVATLLTALGDAAPIELTAFIALANMNARGNVALGITSEDMPTPASFSLWRGPLYARSHEPR